MKQVLMYLKSANLSVEDLAELRAAGFIPIKVRAFSDVRIIDPFASCVDSSAVFASAMEAICNSSSSKGPRTLFGETLAKKLLAIKPVTP